MATPTPTNPADIAREVIRQLAQRRTAPTPENYARAYAARSGRPLAEVQPAIGALLTVAEGLRGDAAHARQAKELAEAIEAGDWHSARLALKAAFARAPEPQFPRSAPPAEALPSGPARLPFVREAAVSLNIGAQNEYRKITLLRRTQTILLMTGLPLLLAAVWLIAANADHFAMVDRAWVMVASACLGALGGVASSLQRLTRNRADRIPLVIGNYVVSFTRAMIGAAAGLIAYLAQRVIIETDGAAKVGGILAAAFAAGFAERLLPADPMPSEAPPTT